jgi:phosphoserine phosphatase RsbU/P
MNTRSDERDEQKRLQALLEMVRQLGITCDLDKLLKMVVNYSMELLNAERATLFLYDKANQQLYTRIAEGTEGFRIPLNSGLAGAAAVQLKTINVPDAYQDERFNRQVDAQTGFRTRSILTCPVVDYDGGLVGVLQVLNKRSGPFDDQDIQLAEAFSAQAGVALQRAYLIEEFLEKQRLENALKIANEIQQELLPKRAPDFPGFDIACWNRPCDAIGGDYCDFLTIDSRRLMLTLGDVTGHGVGPALISCTARAMQRALMSVQPDVESVIARVNALMAAELAYNRFVTAFLGMLDNSTGRLSYFSAGQGPLLWLHADSDRVDSLSADGIPIGILDDWGAIQTQTLDLKPGDVFALLTDGFYEWTRSDGEMFGADRVIETIRKVINRSAADMLQAVKSAVEDFADTKQADDLTIIIIKRT